MSEAGALAGLRVLDFSHVFAGPFCTRTLADLGADVVHVESTARDPGDRYRAAYQHRNKRSIGLNLKTEGGNRIARRLGAVADVVLENFSSGVMQRLGLDYAALAPDNPRLIFISLSGYGHTGPRSAWLSMNMNLQAYTGLMLTTGAEGDPPTAISNSWNDYVGGLHGLIAILQALSDRAETGRGRNIDLSQFECSVATVGALLLSSAISGQPPRRWGNRSSNAAPQGVYPCAGTDQWVAITVRSDAEWRSLASAIGQPAWGADARFATTIARLRAHGQLDATIAAWTRTRTPREVEGVLQPLGVSAERMRRVEDVVRSEDSGDVYRPFPGRGGRTVLAASVPFTFSESPVSAVRPPTPLGHDTGEVLREWLNLPEHEIAELDGAHALA